MADGWVVYCAVLYIIFLHKTNTHLGSHSLTYSQKNSIHIYHPYPELTEAASQHHWSEIIAYRKLWLRANEELQSPEKLQLS